MSEMSTTASSDQVQITGQHPLQCASKAAVAAVESPFKLGPLDELVFASVPIECVYVYEKPELSPKDRFISVERLRDALSYLLNYYPHLTGRLEFNSQTRAPEITHLRAGAELLEAQCNARLDDIASSDCDEDRILLTNLPDCGSALTPPFDSSMDAISREPILAIQHTRFACGGVALGIRLHHIVCDASGLFQLVRDLAEVYRGLSSSSRPTLASCPEIRSYLRDVSILSSEEQQNSLKYQPEAYHFEIGSTASCPESTPETTFESNPSTKPPVTGRILNFSGDDLIELKKSAANPSGESFVSTFEALSAFLYQQIYRARIQLLLSKGTSSSKAASKVFPGFGASINMRSHHRLNLPAKYFPNAIYPSFATTSPEILTEGPLWKIASTLQKQVRAIDAQQMQQTARWIAMQPDKSRIRLNFTFADGNFTINQWSGFGMYVGVDFDTDELGQPIPPALVSPPFTDMSRIDGLATILSTEEEIYRALEQNGSSQASKKPCAVDVNLTLSEPLWQILEADEQFGEYFY